MKLKECSLGVISDYRYVEDMIKIIKCVVIGKYLFKMYFWRVLFGDSLE